MSLIGSIPSVPGSRQRQVEQVKDGVAHHLDLAGAAVAGVHLQTSIVRLQQHALVAIAGEGKAGWRAVGVNVGLDSAEQHRSRFPDDNVVVDDDIGGAAGEDELHLASVLSPRGEQWVPRPRRACILGAPQRRRKVARERDDPCPQLGRFVTTLRLTSRASRRSSVSVTPGQVARSSASRHVAANLASVMPASARRVAAGRVPRTSARAASRAPLAGSTNNLG